MYYFAYGMNTNLEQMTLRAPRARCLGPARLPYHRFRFAFHADIVPDRKNVVHGVLWKITPECQRALDQLEGYPDYYNICEVDVVCDGKIYTAEAYYMNPGHPDCLPSNGYLEMVLKGYNQNGVNTEQITRALEAINSDSVVVDNSII